MLEFLLPGIIYKIPMDKKYKFAFFLSLSLGAVFFVTPFVHGEGIFVLDSKGPVAAEQRDLMRTAISLMALVCMEVSGEQAAGEVCT